jgi:hypothetical protein
VEFPFSGACGQQLIEPPSQRTNRQFARNPQKAQQCGDKAGPARQADETRQRGCREYADPEDEVVAQAVSARWFVAD